MGGKISVFVYGTLMTGEENHHVVAPYVLSVQPGTVLGNLYDAGPYPALVPGFPGGPVYGEWLEVTEAGLAAMDELEQYYGPNHPANDYERVRITDLDGVRSGWVYVWTDSRGCPPIPGGNWRNRK